MIRDRFVGRIAGAGSTSGVRVVIGHWPQSPLGSFTDAMVADTRGHRTLVAPSAQVAEYIADTYEFDDVVQTPIAFDATDRTWHFHSEPLSARLALGRRTALGLLLRPLPRRLTAAPALTLITDPIARIALRGVRTRGTAGSGRREFYGAHDVREVTALSGTWLGADLGQLAPVTPEPDFGFSSTPRRPSVTDVTTTVER